MRVLPLLLALSCLARADVGTLLARAKTRLAHGNEDGARALYERTLAEDPSCGEALAWLASKERAWSEITLHLRYLTDAKPLDADTAAQLLLDLGGDVVDPPDALLRWAERGAMSDAGARGRPCGPWRPWHRPDAVPPATEAEGPLRTEAFPEAAHACRHALLRVAARFERERVSSAPAWARLAVCLDEVGEAPAARAALARAEPRTLDEQVEVARCAFHVFADPSEWWDSHGEALVAAITRAGPDPGGRAEAARVLWHAYNLLAERRNLRGAVSLATAFASCGAPGEEWWELDPLARCLGHDWRAEEVYAATQGDPSPAVRCLGAAVLWQMGQLDRALVEMERLARDDPDDLLARGCLPSLYTTGTLQRARACVELDALARRLGRRLAPGIAVQCAQGARLVEGDDAVLQRVRGLLREDPSLTSSFVRGTDEGEIVPPLEDLLCAAERLARQASGLDAYVASSLLRACLEHHRTEDALRVIGWVQCTNLYDLLAGQNHLFHWEEVYAEMIPLLSAMAAQPRPGENVDAFLLSFPNIEPSDGTPFTAWRMREDLSKDKAFGRLPSADWVLSCLYDPVLDAEKVLELRRGAFRAGCRSRALLIDLVRHEDPVLRELESVDPVAARLERARQSEGTAALEALLESDDLTQDQYWRASQELTDRRGEAPPAARRLEIPDSEDDCEDLPRDVWGVVQQAPPSGWALRHLSRLSNLLPPDIEAQLKGLETHQPSPCEAFFHSHPPAAALAARGPTFTNDWKGAAAHVIETEGKEGYRTLLSGPFGLKIAEWDVQSKEGPPLEDLIDLVQGQARAHPLDLRWLDVEAGLLSDAKKDEPRRKEIARLHMAAAARDPWRLVQCALRCGSDEEKRELCGRALAMFEGVPLASVLPTIGNWMGSPPDPCLGQLLSDWAAARCRTTEDRLALCELALERGRTVEADRIQEEVLRDGNARMLPRVLQVRWGRQLPPMAAEVLHAAARAGTWTTSQARRVWVEVAKAAAHEGNDDLFAEALDEIWRVAPVDWAGIRSSDASHPEGDLCSHSDVAKEVLARFLARPDAPLPVLHLALGTGVRGVAPERLDLVRRRLAREGIDSPEDWLDTVAALPRGPLLERLRAALPLIPKRDGRDHEVLWGICSRLSAAGRMEDVAACADVWASLQPAPEVRAWWKAGIRDDYDGRWNRRPAPPPTLGCPKPPPGAHPLPSAASAVEVLAEMGFNVAAAQEAAQAAGEARDPVAGEAMRFVEAQVLAACGRSDEAMPLLLALREGSTGDWLRADAADDAVALFRKVSSTRRAWVDACLQVQDVPPPGADDVRAWEARLGAESTSERERATSELRAKGEGALGLLRALRASDDPEVRARAEGVLEDLLAP